MVSDIGFDLKALEVFAAIVETGGLTSAGHRLGLTQSSISQILANLERSLLVQLLDRSQRPTMLTPLGRNFYERARRLLDEARKISMEFRREENLLLKQVRVALVDSLATSFGKELVDAIKKRTSQWTLITGQSHRHAESLISRKADILISDESSNAFSDFFRRTIIREPFVLVLPRQYSEPIGSLRILASSMDFIRYSQGTIIGRTIEDQLRQWRIDPPLRLQLDNTFAISAAVEAGIGWTISTPLCLLESGLKSNAIQILPIPEGAFYRELTLVTRHGELGHLPNQLADDIVTLLRSSYIPAIEENAPWLKSYIRLGT